MVTSRALVFGCWTLKYIFFNAITRPYFHFYTVFFSFLPSNCCDFTSIVPNSSVYWTQKVECIQVREVSHIYIVLLLFYLQIWIILFLFISSSLVISCLRQKLLSLHQKQIRFFIFTRCCCNQLPTIQGDSISTILYQHVFFGDLQLEITHLSLQLGEIFQHYLVFFVVLLSNCL